MPRNEKPGAGTPGGANGGAGNASFHSQNSTPERACQAPDAAFRPYLKDGMVWCAGRHLAAVRNGQLRRTFDASRELLRGSLLFRLDVLDLAEKAGATVIVCTERNTGAVYTVGMADFRRLAWQYKHPAFGAQLGLALIHWQKEEPESQMGPAQLTLWGARP